MVISGNRFQSIQLISHCVNNRFLPLSRPKIQLVITSYLEVDNSPSGRFQYNGKASFCPNHKG